MPSTTAPIARLDIESAFLLVAPLVSLDRRVEGTFQLAVERARLGTEGEGPWAGARLTLEKGSVASCVARIEAKPRNWALGTPSAWLHAVIGRDPDRLRYGGEAELARQVVAGIHDGLFADFSPQLQSSSGAPARDPGPP